MILRPDEQLAALRAQGDRLAAAAGTGGAVVVPSCPGWTIDDLVGHTASVHQWVAHIVRTGEAVRRRDLPAPPPDHEALLAWYRAGLSSLIETLGAASPEAETWTFAVHSPSTAGWWMRRMAQETAVHRWDAEAAIAAAGNGGGVRSAEGFVPDLAVDGIDEYLMDFLPDVTGEERAALAGTLHLHATDAEGEWIVDLSEPGAPARREHAKADTAVRGPASDLLLWLWNRQPAAGRLEVFGDGSVVDGWVRIRI
jgi:uncharacterized protein (TIGR03083 family)